MGQSAARVSHAACRVARHSTEQLGMTADLLSILSAAFRLPVRALVVQIASGRLGADLDELAGALGLKANCRHDLAPYDGADETACLHELRSEYTRLFVGAPTPEVWPYEGVRHAIARGSEPLLFIGGVTEEVEGSYRAAGFSRKPDAPNEPPDHIAVELEFLARLAYAAADGASRSALASFAQEHSAFFGELADDVVAATSNRFYRSMANLLSQSKVLF